MKKLSFLFIAIFVLSSHDMFLKMNSFFLEPESPASIHLYNGTFELSENVITRDRMIDVSIVSNGMRQSIDTSSWTEEGNTTILNFNTEKSGTYVAGVSTHARNIALSAEDFKAYLEHDGVLDMLASRDENGSVDQDAVEKYSKHVKAVFQVGDQRSEDYRVSLGYPIEFVPESNPYDLSIGDHIKVKLLRDDQPLTNQLVYTGFAGGGHTHDHNESNDQAAQEAHHHDENQLRTDENGHVDVKIDHGGQWYIRTIHMVETNEDSLTHESNWATLTFEVAGSGHGGLGFQIWLYAIGGILLVGLLYYFMRN